MKHGDRKEDAKGWLVWHQPEGCIEGWWSRIEEEEYIKERVPLSCNSCDLLLDNWNETYHHRWGVCSNCYYDFLHNRENLENLKTNRDREAFCKQKVAERSNNK